MIICIGSLTVDPADKGPVLWPAGGGQGEARVFSARGEVLQAPAIPLCIRRSPQELVHVVVHPAGRGVRRRLRENHGERVEVERTVGRMRYTLHAER